MTLSEPLLVTPSARKGPRNGPGPRGAENLNRFRERLDDLRGLSLAAGGWLPCRHQRRVGLFLVDNPMAFRRGDSRGLFFRGQGRFAAPQAI